MFDTVTKLTWQRGSNPTSVSWINAKSYCQNLVLASHDDWRLPSVIELQSIVSYSQVDPAINTQIFANTELNSYWSATSSAAGGNVLGVSFQMEILELLEPLAC